MANSEESSERVLLADPTEPIVTFFLRVPEPLSLPEYTVFPEHVHASALPMGWLERGAPSDSQDGGRDYTRTFILGSSIIVHQVKVSVASSLGLDAAMRAAIVGIRGPGDYPIPNSDDLDADCTILEVALPMWVNLTVYREKLRLGPDVPGDVRDWDAVSGESVDLLFRLAIDRVRHLQKSYHAVENAPITLLTAELLPPIIPYLIRLPEQIANGEVDELKLYFSRRSFNAITRGEDISNERIAEIFKVSGHVANSPLAEYRDLDREASVALLRSGNTRVSVVMAAASAEVILDRTLMLMLWEECNTPEQAADSWRDALKRRVELEYAPRIGGSWNLKADNPIGRWARNVAQVRNRVVHGGYLPTNDEAESAIKTARELVTFLGDRLAYGANLRKYPRSAVLIIGQDGLTRRRRYTPEVQALQADRNEPPWMETFSSWFRAFSRLRGDLLDPRNSRLENASLYAVYFPDAWPKYIANDDSTGQAVEVSVPGEIELGNTRNMVNEVFLAHSGSAHRANPISIKIAGGVPSGVEVNGSWVEEYHLLPLRGVMADWSNFSR